MENKSENKKSYRAPTLTEHGDIVERTTGMGGEYWEAYGRRFSPVIIDPDDPDGTGNRF